MIQLDDMAEESIHDIVPMGRVRRCTTCVLMVIRRVGSCFWNILSPNNTLFSPFEGGFEGEGNEVGLSMFTLLLFF